MKHRRPPVAWAAFLAATLSFPGANAAPAEVSMAPVPRGPDFASALRALDIDRSVEFAERSRRMVERVLDENQRLETAAEPILQGSEGKLFVRGESSADQPRLVWLDELAAPPPRQLADFVLRAEARDEMQTRDTRLSFHSVVGITPAEIVEVSQRVVGELEGSDAAILAAYRRDLPEIAAWSARILDLSKAKVVAPGESSDYTTLSLEAPLDEDALAAHYPTLGKLLAWARELGVIVSDDRGRVLTRLSFDGSERSFRILEFKRGRDLLWSDGEKPLRSPSGELVPVRFDPTQDATFRVRIDARAAMIRLGSVRIGSVGLPSSDLELRSMGDPKAENADWRMRIVSIEDAPAVFEWMLPLSQLRESLVRTFQLTLVSRPSSEMPAFQDLGISIGSQLPRSATLDFAQSMMRWASDSFAFEDVLKAGRDFAAAAGRDLTTLRSNPG